MATVCILLMLSACGSSNTQKKEITAEVWKTYSNGVVSEVTFNEDGNGVWKGDSIFNFIWTLKDEKLTMTYSFLGETKEVTYSLMSTDGKYELVKEEKPEQEEVATFWGQLVGSDFEKKDIAIRNFTKELIKVKEYFYQR